MSLITYRSMQFATDPHVHHVFFIVMEGLASLQPPFVCASFESYANLLIKMQPLEYSIILVSNKTLLFFYVYTCIADQNAYSKVSDTFIDKKKLKLSFVVLESSDAIIQLSWGIKGDG